ncbi:MAG: EamA family transporter, partial [Bdellovibrionaceae bacterium]|nr:EamA family transporter [Pseudobdellovibrionaceae bacterium]
MDPQRLALFYALGSTLVFSTSSLGFALYSRRVSVMWMNAFKAAVAGALLVITIPIVLGGWSWPGVPALIGLLTSGLVGLNIGDLFLLTAFTRLGPGRTLILFGFSPLIVGTGAALVFGQAMDPRRLIAVIFLIACLFCFSLEKYQREKKWEWHALVFALIGVTMDACGILLTRWSFQQAPTLTPLESHFWRCLGALAGFGVFALIKPFGFWSNFKRWKTKDRLVILASCFGGTYLSLILFLTAVKTGHLASITAIGITGPIFATGLECAIHR